MIKLFVPRTPQFDHRYVLINNGAKTHVNK